MDLPESLFEKFVIQPRGRRIVLSVSLVLITAPFVAAYLEDRPSLSFRQGIWRGFLLPPIVMLYILIVAPIRARIGTSVVESFRSLTLIDNDGFNSVVRESSYIKPSRELVAFTAGALLGLASVIANSDQSISWLIVILGFSTCLIDGLLAWTIYVSIANTRLNTALLRLPIHVDPFDITPFEPIGRQSLLLALVFSVLIPVGATLARLALEVLFK